jgi:zinc protease
MRRVHLSLLACVAACVLLAAPIAHARWQVQSATVGDRIPIDPRITVRTLPNGLRTYVRANRTPAGRAELRLVVNAGSVLEEDDQRGLAHFVEHMAFNGTRRFPRQDMASFLQSIGMRFGSHVNAYTGFDETVYQLHVPIGDPRVLSRAIDMIEDWALNVTFDPAEVERERGVILEEWRLGLGPDARLRDAQWPVLFAGSRYADRLPIGVPEVIRQASRDRIRQFYRDWYRPEMMAVIAVGDFDAAATDLMLSARLSAWPTSLPQRTRPDINVPPSTETRFAVATDAEAGATTLGVLRFTPAREQGTTAYYRQMTIDRLIAAMFSERLADVSRRPDAPFLAAQAGKSLFVRPVEMTALQAMVANPGSIAAGVQALLAEWQRVVAFGFTGEELDRQKRSLGRGLAQALVEQDTSDSVELADEFVRNFLTGESLPGIVREEAMARQILESLTIADVNQIAAAWLPESNRVLMVGAPARTDAPLPTHDALALAMRPAAAGPASASIEAVDASPLVAPLPSPGRIVSERTPVPGVVEWTLSNGARVVIHPTTHRTDEVLLRAFSPGGWSLAPQTEHVVAVTAAEVVSDGGLGRWSRSGLVKRLAGVNAGLRVDIDDDHEGIRGAASASDLETLLQLVHLSFTAPRADPQAFQVFREQVKRSLEAESARSEVLFAHAVQAALTGEHPRAQPLTPAAADRLDLDQSMALYRDRFGDAGDFLFMVVGNVTPSALRPLAERYLASLPTRGRIEAPRDLGVRTPPGIVRRDIRVGQDPRSQVSLSFTGTFVNTPVARQQITTMAQMLGGHLTRVLREEMGGTYGVGVEPQFFWYPQPEYRVTVTFACDPDRLDALLAATWKTIEQFREVGPSANQVADALVTRRRDREAWQRDNEQMMARLLQAYTRGEDLRQALDDAALDREITVETVRDAARQVLSPDRYVLVTQRPDR